MTAADVIASLVAFLGILALWPLTWIFGRWSYDGRRDLRDEIQRENLARIHAARYKRL